MKRNDVRVRRHRPALAVLGILATVLALLLGACSQPNLAAPANGSVQPNDFLVVTSANPTPQSLASSTVSGTIQVYLSGNSPVGDVAYFVDALPGDVPPSADETQAPFRFTLDTATLGDGPHTLVADVGYDGTGSSAHHRIKIDFTTHNGSASRNLPPLVSAGSDLSTAVGASATLQGSASDDGLPNGTLTVTWSAVSGPGTVTFSRPHALTTKVSFSAAGSYRLRLTADDGAASTSDTMAASVTAAATTNTAPTVDAGPDTQVSLPNAATLMGSVSDDGLPNGQLSVRWSAVSGPAPVTFSDPTSASTSVSFTAAGQYLLRLTADDGALSTSDTVTVTVQPAPSSGGSSVKSTLDLVGNPNFSEADLSPSVRVWYDRMIAAMNNPNEEPNPVKTSSTGDSYMIGRYTGADVTTLLTVFRFTGDLRLLDNIDKAMQAARAQLKDYNGDGFLNWRWLEDPSNTTYYGTDYNLLDEIMSAGLVAEVAWAYQENRNLTSPAGINYGERADFWLSYLKQWEAKWRLRDNVPTGFPFIQKDIIHARVNLIRYLWYMHRLTGRQDYLDEATRLANEINTHELRPITTPDGPGFVWAEVITSHEPKSQWWLDALHYARYTTLVLLDLSYEPFAPFTPTKTLIPIAHTIATKVIDNGATDFAPTIGGSSPIGGLSPATTQRTDITRWGIYSFTFYAAYDTTGKIATTSEQVYNKLESDPNDPTRIYIPAGLVVDGLIQKNFKKGEDASHGH